MTVVQANNHFFFLIRTVWHRNTQREQNATSGRLRLKCDGTGAETIFPLSAKRTSPLISAGASVQSTSGSRGVRISGSNAGYTMFRGSVKGTGYSLHSPVSSSLPLPCGTVSHHISTGLYVHLPLGFKRLNESDNERGLILGQSALVLMKYDAAFTSHNLLLVFTLVISSARRTGMYKLHMKCFKTMEMLSDNLIHSCN